jgi:DNA invertase Pin-like site-specific DNA recombinase
MQAYRYHRFSSKAQDKGSSLDRQDQATADLCGAHGWTVAETLQDLGRSAWRGDHLRVGELGKFKARVESGEISEGSVLVIENLDRLSRQDMKQARRWIEDVTDRGVLVAVCRPELIIDADAMSGVNFASMVQYTLEAHRSTKESDRKSHMLRDKWVRWREDAKAGKVISARCPGWLKLDEQRRFVVVEARAEVVRQIYRWSADGLGAGGICKKLNALGVPSWGRNQHKRFDHSWRPGYVRDLLASPAVEGDYLPATTNGPTGERISGYYGEPIVDADLVARARAARARRSTTGGVHHAEARNLFTGRTRCHHCGNTMIRVVQRNTRGKRYEYFKCLSYQNGAPCPNRTLYDYTAFERDALEQMLHLALDDSHFSRTNETASLAVALAGAQKAADEKRVEQQRLVRALARHDDAPEIEAELRSIRRELVSIDEARDRAEVALAHARGAVSPEEHLQRVIEVRDAIHDEDQDTRTAARRKVRDAVGSIVTLVECRLDDPVADGGKTLTMILAGGYMAFKFAHRGGLLAKIDLHDQPALQQGIKGTGGEQAMHEIQRRNAA